MKKMLLAAAAASAVLATPAMAAETATYDVTGSVAAVCAVSTGSAVSFSSLTDNTGVLNATTTDEATDAAAYCNGSASTVKVEHVALKRQVNNADDTAAPPSPFVNQVDFTPVVTIGSTTYSSSTATLVGAFSGLKVKAITPTTTGNAKPLAGSYKGSITVTLSPVA
ncbi:hypothetical protein [Sphingobium bisphenolivorans]|uniref:hypothetical protein n=1 Tax=Sphingobium bisphenolivorans TaxID=1335760 RepID=UPI0003A8432A|nr:hypothetical protein [Sphingobium bisphenolivorans]